MRHLLLGLALLASPASAEFDYTSVKELRRAGLPAQIAEAKRLKTILELFFESADSDELKETVDVVFLWDRTVKDLARDLPYLEGVKKTGRLVVPKATPPTPTSRLWRTGATTGTTSTTRSWRGTPSVSSTRASST